MEFQINQDIKWRTHSSLVNEVEHCHIHLFHQQHHPMTVKTGKINMPYSEEGVILSRHEQVLFDFGAHQVGRITLQLDPIGSPPDAPVKLYLQFGEQAFEVERDFRTFRGDISASWLQEELLTQPILPATVELSQRYAFRYVKLIVIDTSPKYNINLRISCRTESAVDTTTQCLLDQTSDPLLQRIDSTAQLTLAACMQEVFEDGPKRDRRLWLGDLKLQALANYETFDNTELVRKCLLQFAAITRQDGLVAANIFNKPRLLPDDTFLLDYSLFFIDTLLSYFEHTNDRVTLNLLFPTAYRQAELLSAYIQASGQVTAPPGWSAFIDWSEGLDKELALQGIFISSYKKLVRLIQLANLSTPIADLQETIESMLKWAVARFSPTQHCFVTSSGQISQHSQVWMSLAEVGTPAQRIQALKKCLNDSAMIQCTTPYMYHYLVTALFENNMNQEALNILKDYWGGMLEAGADTFWEAYSPTDPDFSPYGDTLANSYCHAWSCTPCYLLRKYKEKS